MIIKNNIHFEFIYTPIYFIHCNRPIKSNHRIHTFTSFFNGEKSLTHLTAHSKAKKRQHTKT